MGERVWNYKYRDTIIDIEVNIDGETLIEKTATHLPEVSVVIKYFEDYCWVYSDVEIPGATLLSNNVEVGK